MRKIFLNSFIVSSYLHYYFVSNDNTNIFFNNIDY